jgi:hypothetical protein
MCIECYIEYRDEMEYKHRENNRWFTQKKFNISWTT